MSDVATFDHSAVEASKPTAPAREGGDRMKYDANRLTSAIRMLRGLVTKGYGVLAQRQQWLRELDAAVRMLNERDGS